MNPSISISAACAPPPDQVAVDLVAGWLIRVADAPGGVSRTIGVMTRSD